MNYLINEGTLTLPWAAEDDSVNILKFPALGASLVVTRAVLRDNMTVDNYITTQMAALRKSMKNFIAGDRITVPFSVDPAAMNATEIHCEFEQQGQRLYQCLLISQSGQSLLVLAWSQTRPFTPADIQHWKDIRASFRPVTA
ncbi:DcrB-related protein [Pseudocitrobacter cyperus]|uniref:DcrB-related protein n=1 Tax=Pseudocitrobacter cyperus TaxID=3112843 RepID=A0ABV0HEW7_9ENTR